MENQLLPTAENITCASSHIHLRLEVVTDIYPQDTSWQFIDRTSNIILLTSPSGGYRGEDLGHGTMEAQSDFREICLDFPSAGAAASTTRLTNRYEFVFNDKYGDGLCCRANVEPGYYKLLQKKYNTENNSEEEQEDEWQVLVAGSDFNAKVVNHYFELRHDHNEDGLPGIEQSILDDALDEETTLELFRMASSALELFCPPPQRKITIQIQTVSVFFAQILHKLFVLHHFFVLYKSLFHEPDVYSHSFLR